MAERQTDSHTEADTVTAYENKQAGTSSRGAPPMARSLATASQSKPELCGGVAVVAVISSLDEAPEPNERH